jgi:hypothetical protein
MRLGVMLGFLAFLSFRPALAGRCARIIGAAFALLFVMRMAIVSTAWWDFRTDISNTRILLRNVNRGERLAELNFEPEDVPDYFSNVPTSWRISNHQRTTIHLMAMIVRSAGRSGPWWSQIRTNNRWCSIPTGSPWRNRH